MTSRRLGSVWLLPGIALLAAMILLWPSGRASAQCGSQASSCKNCHEVQAQMPVNADGSSWHPSHAFGDFCEFCHAGNVQAPEKEAAHAGLVAPLADVQASCGSCHPADLEARVEKYAVTLGVEFGLGGDAGSGQGQSAGDDAQQAGEGADSGLSEGSALVTGDAEVIDYARRYDQASQAGAGLNTGDMIVSALIVIVLAGGGAYVYWNERRLRGLARPGPAAAAEAARAPGLDDFPPEVVDLLPRIAGLNPAGLHALRKLLERPEEASELLLSLSRLDPDLVRRIRNLDREARALLIGLSGD